MKKLVIFDLDGTLLNTIADLACATNHALTCCGFPTHETDEYCHFVGRGINNLFRSALPETERTDENVLRMRAAFLPYYNEHNAENSKPYEGITKVLEELHNAGLSLAVASNKYQQATEKLIRFFFPSISFCAVLGQREGVPIKPDPSIVHLILETAGVSASEALYVGDSGIDMQTAANAHVDSVGVTWGFRSAEELRANGAKQLAHTPDDILRIALS